ADLAVAVPEIAVARQSRGHSLLLFIGRIDADPEKRRPLIVKQRAVGKRGRERRLGTRVAGAHEKTQHQIAPRCRIKGIVRVDRGALMEPRRRVARQQVAVAGHARNSLRAGTLTDRGGGFEAAPRRHRATWFTRYRGRSGKLKLLSSTNWPSKT